MRCHVDGKIIKLRYKKSIAIVYMNVNVVMLGFIMSDQICNERDTFGETKSEYLHSRDLCVFVLTSFGLYTFIKKT